MPTESRVIVQKRRKYSEMRKRFLNSVHRAYGEWRCEYCGVMCRSHEAKNVPKVNRVTIDHHEPQYRDPSNLYLNRDNFRISCYQCNQVRNDVDCTSDMRKKLEIVKKYMKKYNKILENDFFLHIF